MAWLAQYPDSSEIKRQAEKALSLQIGLASPFWLAFGAAASAGVTWWWMNRWTVGATHLEAALAPRVAPPIALPKAALVEIIAEPVEVAAPEPVALAVVTPVVAITPEPVAAIKPEPVVLAAPEPEPVAPDDLTRLVGIGPKVAAALAARGVTRYAQLAAWTVDDMARFDAELKLLGRGARDAWIAQAKCLAAEG